MPIVVSGEQEPSIKTAARRFKVGARYGGGLAFQALSDTWDHGRKLSIFGTLLLFTIGYVRTCALEPHGTRCDVTSFIGGLEAVGIWLLIVFFANLLIFTPYRRTRRLEQENRELDSTNKQLQMVEVANNRLAYAWADIERQKTLGNQIVSRIKEDQPGWRDELREWVSQTHDAVMKHFSWDYANEVPKLPDELSTPDAGVEAIRPIIDYLIDLPRRIGGA